MHDLPLSLVFIKFWQCLLARIGIRAGTTATVVIRLHVDCFVAVEVAAWRNGAFVYRPEVGSADLLVEAFRFQWTPHDVLQDFIPLRARVGTTWCTAGIAHGNAWTARIWTAWRARWRAAGVNCAARSWPGGKAVRKSEKSSVGLKFYLQQGWQQMGGQKFAKWPSSHSFSSQGTEQTSSIVCFPHDCFSQDILAAWRNENENSENLFASHFAFYRKNQV